MGRSWFGLVPWGSVRTEQQMNLATQCGSPAHFSRRSAIAAGLGLSGIPWLTAAAERLSHAEAPSRGRSARSLIVLWMAGGPSQLETFDPHAGSPGAHESTQAIKTAAGGIEIADTLP